MTTLLVMLCGGAALWPLWSAARSRGQVAFAAAASLVLLAVVVAVASTPPPPGPVPTAPLVAPARGYVGSASCRSCHPEEHATWHESFHRSMTQVATRATLAASFDRLQLDWFGKPVVLEWRGDTLWVDFERGGARPAHVQRPVEQLTGSHHLQVLWYSTGSGRELAPVPLVYKLAERLWLPLTSVFVLPPEFRDPPEPGAWNRSCQMCHATDVRPKLDVDHCATEVSELGIACEACHGPGADHVARHHDPLQRLAQRAATAADPTIVHPDHLPADRASMVCGQCHSVNILRLQHFEGWREHGLVYRPGGDLHQSNLVIQPGSAAAALELTRTLQHNPAFFQASFWSDGEVRLSGREYNGLLQSKCHTDGSGARQLGCTSCHQLHRDHGTDPAAWRDDQLHPERTGNAACTTCHPALAEPAALTAHTHHAPTSLGSRCLDCHMPHTTFGLMKAMRSHTIRSPDVAAELATGRPNACNLCHLDRPLGWTAEHLQAWYSMPAPALDDEARTVAAGARWLLTGDAAQRALAAAAFGRAEAQATAGTDWLAPYLARLLDDPYHVVRFGAARSLRSLPGLAGSLEGYDFLGAPERVAPYVDAVTRQWAASAPATARPAVLLQGGRLDLAAFGRLYARRDDRPVYLAE